MSHDVSEGPLSTQLPSPGDIAMYYDRLLDELGGEYIHQRWGNSEIKRRHYRQTELAIRHVLATLPTVGDVLEIGCGPAVWTTLFLGQSRSVSLVDISEEMLSHARIRVGEWDAGRHANKVSYTCGDFIELALHEKSYDTIVSARAFEYMSDKAAFVAKCFSLLRPGGTLLVVTKSKGWHDLKKRARELAGVPRSEMSVPFAMQLDLVSWHDAIGMFKSAGFSAASAYPVVLGSYDWSLLAGRLGLTFTDLLHRSIYRRPINALSRFVDPVMESYSVVGTKSQ
jgi:ubiquinone/menaquinone biosynthesis C-methylase UbiE